MDAALDLNILHKNLDELKQALNSSRIYLAEFFSDLCQRIDIQCELYLQAHSENQEKSTEALKSQAQMIEQVKLLEEECLSHVADSQMDASLARKSAKLMLKIESELKCPLIVEEKIRNRFVALTHELVHEKLVQVQKYLFKNKSVWFFPKEYSHRHKIFKFSSFGFLTIVLDEFLSQKRLEINIAKFNSQDLKSTYLLSALRKKPALEAVNSESLNINQIKNYYLATIFRSLTKLNADIFNGFTSLTLIDLSYNKLRSLEPQTFQQLVQLETLNLNNNEFVFLDPKLFKGLASLVRLDLHNNKLLSLDTRTFHGLHKLESLDLSTNSLIQVVPGLFRDLQSLMHLRLSYNLILAVEPAAFHHLPMLANLNLSHNRLTALEKNAFASLASLLVLNLGHNCLRRIHPDCLASLHNLNTLSLSQNEIFALPSRVLGAVGNLEQLSLANNFLSYLDSSTFQGLSKLRKIYLCNNRLVYLDSQLFRSVTGLEMLNLNGNSQLSFEAEVVEGLAKLEMVSVASCSLEVMEHLSSRFERNSLKVFVK